MEDELQDSDASLSGDETKDGTYIPPAEENKQKITVIILKSLPINT